MATIVISSDDEAAARTPTFVADELTYFTGADVKGFFLTCSESIPASKDVVSYLRKQVVSPEFLLTSVVFIVLLIVIECLNISRLYHALNVYLWVSHALVPHAKTAQTFFVGDMLDTDKSNLSYMVIALSTMISWIFAKSVQNASTLGAKYGLIGGFAYAAWYVAFFSTAAVIYRFRMQGYTSLPQVILHRYGPASMLLFALALLYRLYNEVWSNSIVIATFFTSEAHTPVWWSANVCSVLLPLSYVFTGGMRSSMIADCVQSYTFILGVIIVLCVIAQQQRGNEALVTYLNENHYSANMFTYNPSGPKHLGTQMDLAGGMDLFVVGAVQGLFSYPFFDPVLTDRAFLGHPRMMARAVLCGGLLAGFFIVIFSFIGIYGNQLARCVDAGACPVSDLRGADLALVKAGYPSEIGKTLGGGMEALLFIVMITSSISTLDSTFTSTAKLCGPDIYGWFMNGQPTPQALATDRMVLIGRIAMVLVMLVGVLNLLVDVNALNATTVSGTVVMGLSGPVTIMALIPEAWMWKSGTRRPLAFLVPVISGIILGVCYQIKYASRSPSSSVNPSGNLMYQDYVIDFSALKVGTGGSGILLGVNILGTCLSIFLFWVFGFNDFCLGNDYDPDEQPAIIKVWDAKTKKNDGKDSETAGEEKREKQRGSKAAAVVVALVKFEEGDSRL